MFIQRWSQHKNPDSDLEDKSWPEARVGHTAVSLHDPDSNPEEPELLILWGQDDKKPVSTLKDSWILKVCKNGTINWSKV